MTKIESYKKESVYNIITQNYNWIVVNNVVVSTSLNFFNISDDIELSNDNIDINDKINQRENENIEFKESFKWDIKEKKVNKVLPKMVTKSICAFSNSNGGKMFIGVRDDDKKIMGIDNDIKNIYKNTDKFEQDVCIKIREDLGQGVVYTSKIVKIEDKLIYYIDVKPSKQAVYFVNREYFVRRGTSNHNCNPKEASEHKSNRYY